MRKIIKARRRRPEDEARARRPARHPFSGLTADQLIALEMGYHDNSFGSEAARRAAYQRYRGDLIEHTRLGRRPSAFWDYEPGLPDDVRDTTEDDLQLADRHRARVTALGREHWASQVFESGVFGS